MKKNKVGLIHSIAMKVVWCIVFAVAVTSGLMLWLLLPMIKSNISSNIENHMCDMSRVYGENIEGYIGTVGKEQALAQASLTSMLDGVSISGVSSSYVYITDGAGTMLYHPDASKIGNEVENEVVKGVVAQIKQGKVPEPAFVSYDYRGAIKYAAYYVGSNGDYVLVMSADESDVLSNVQTMWREAIVCGVLAMLVCAVLGFVLSKIVIKPITLLAENVLRFAELDFTESDLQEKLNKRKDESGLISRAISTLREQLVKAVLQIREQSTRLYEESDYLSSSALETNENIGQVETAVGEIADGANSQAEETQKATENVILIGSMVEETGHQVEMLNTNAGKMQQASIEAMDTLQQLDATNGKTREAIDKIYEQTNTTNESALKIREATALITSIAEETNLLSLNASIEAARAGEQGRGFAVVAGQIQKLAEQSNESARQIEEIVDSLIRDSEEAVATMNNVKTIIAAQSANVEKTGAGFAEVKDGIDSSIDGVKAISESISKMDEARVKVVDVVQNLTAIAEENAAGTEETSASVTEVTATVQNMADHAGQLKDVAKGLDDTMAIFKV